MRTIILRTLLVTVVLAGATVLMPSSADAARKPAKSPKWQTTSTTTTTTTIPTSAAPSTTYHVDCVGGSDAADGRSAATAWRSISRANQATLAPGEGLLLKRDCTWKGQRLEARWNGTAQAPILIGNYGTGAKPTILDGTNNGVKVTGSHQILRGLQVDFTRQQVTECGQPIGDYYGVNFTGGAHSNTLLDSEVRHATAGVHLARNSHGNRVLNNVLANNDVAKTWTSNPGQDLGAWGVLVVSDGNEIAHNTFRDNAALCRNGDFQRMSNSVEVFEGVDNHIHHNRAYGDRVFSELGSSSTEVASGNVYAYNLHVSDEPHARFISTRGAGAAFGPVLGTTAIHNTVRFRGDNSQAIVCGGGCGTDVMTVDSNILWAEEKVLYANGPIIEDRNVFWASNGQPILQLPSARSSADASWTAVLEHLSTSTSVIGAPEFMDGTSGDFHLKSTSPAIDRGIRHPDLDRGIDLAKVTLPTGHTEAGAYERA